jgi:putative resolvase
MNGFAIRGANGLTYKTVWRLWRDGRLPIPAEKLATGAVIVHPPQAPAVDSVAIYAQAAGADQEADLERQLGRLADDASREHLIVIRLVSEIGPGLNGHRAKVLRLLADPPARTIVVEHRDRLARFGCEYIESRARGGRKLVVVDQAERKDDLGAGHGGCAHGVLRLPLWSARREAPCRERRGCGLCG